MLNFRGKQRCACFNVQDCDSCPHMMPPIKQFKRFDVRDLLGRGVEPFPQIHARVSKLKPDEGLIIVAPFLPSPLIEKLVSEGFASKVERGSGAEWMIYFWRESA